jgi:hypothetical protein
MVSNVYDHSRRRNFLKGHYRKHGSRKITLIKLFWMVYNKISLHTSKDIKRRNMGEFKEMFWELPHNVQMLIIER